MIINPYVFGSSFPGRRDTFIRSDSSSSMGVPSDGRDPWVALSGIWGINTDRGYNVSLTGDNVVATETGESEGSFETTVSGSAGGAFDGGDMGLVFRLVDVNNFVVAIFSYDMSMSGFAQLSVFEKIAGSYNLLGVGGVGVGLSRPVRVVYAGASVAVQTNPGSGWSTIITRTTTAHLSATQVGFRTTSAVPVYLTDMLFTP